MKNILKISLFVALGVASALGAVAGEMEKDLLKSARKGNLDDLREVILQGAKINASDEEGRTALMLAVIEDEEKTFAYLATHKKVDLNRQDRRGNTALMHAVKEKRERSVKILLANDANVTIKDRDGYSPLNWAKREKRDDFIPILERAEADQKQKALQSEIDRLKHPAPSGSASFGQLDLEKQRIDLEYDRKRLLMETDELHMAKLKLEEDRHRLKLDQETLGHDKRRLEQERRDLEDERRRFESERREG